MSSTAPGVLIVDSAPAYVTIHIDLYANHIDLPPLYADINVHTHQVAALLTACV